MKRRSIILAFALVPIFTPALLAHQTPKPKSTVGPKKTDVKFEFEEFNSRETPQGDIQTMTGNVVIISEDSTLKTDKGIYNKTTDIATSPGPLTLNDSQNTITGSQGVANYRTRDAEITGKVVINARPKPSDKEAPQGSLRREFKEPVTITCTNVRYNWRTRIAVLTGNLVMKQKDRTVTARKAVYDGRAETVTLTGDIKSVRPGLENISAPGDSTAIAVLKEGANEFTVKKDPKITRGGIKGTAKVEQNEETGEVKVPESGTETPQPTPTPTPAQVPPPTAPPTTPPTQTPPGATAP